LRSWIVLVLSMVVLSSHAVFADEITFKGPGEHFKAIKFKDKLDYSDNLGPRSLNIKMCNRSLVDKFWTDMLQNIKATKFKNAKLKLSKGTVTHNGKKYGLLDFEESYRFFNKVPKDIHVVFAESKRLCQVK